MPPWEPDAEVLRTSAVHVVPAIGAEGEGTMARRGGEALAKLLSLETIVFPGDHGGFATNEWSAGNDSEVFAQRRLHRPLIRGAMPPQPLLHGGTSLP